MSKQREIAFPMPKAIHVHDGDETIVTCGACGYTGDIDTFDNAGSDDGLNLFCNACGEELDQ